MADTGASTLLGRGGRVLKSAARTQGAAYAAYGKALERFGEGEIGGGELVKTAGDLYFSTAGKMAVGAAELASVALQGLLSLVGVKTLDQPDPVTETKAAKPAKT